MVYLEPAERGTATSQITSPLQKKREVSIPEPCWRGLPARSRSGEGRGKR
jgi:hypothetical protein